MGGWIKLIGELGLLVWEAFKPKPPTPIPTPHKPAFSSIEEEEAEALRLKRQTDPTKP